MKSAEELALAVAAYEDAVTELLTTFFLLSPSDAEKRVAKFLSGLEPETILHAEPYQTASDIADEDYASEEIAERARELGRNIFRSVFENAKTHISDTTISRIGDQRILSQYRTIRMGRWHPRGGTLEEKSKEYGYLIKKNQTGSQVSQKISVRPVGGR